MSKTPISFRQLFYLFFSPYLSPCLSSCLSPCLSSFNALNLSLCISLGLSLYRPFLSLLCSIFCLSIAIFIILSMFPTLQQRIPYTQKSFPLATFRPFIKVLYLFPTPSILFFLVIHIPPMVQSFEVGYVSEPNKIASKCRVPSPEEQKKAHLLSDLLIKKMEEIKSQFQKENKVFQFALVARAGINADPLQVLKDSQDGNSISLKDIYEDVQKLMPTNPEDQLRFSNYKIDAFIQQQYADPHRKITYSHLGILKPDLLLKPRNDIKIEERNPDGSVNRLVTPWGVIHRLKPCENSEAHVFRETFPTFFSDNPSRWETLVIVPNQYLQKKFAELKPLWVQYVTDFSDKFVSSPKYNLAAMPFQTFEQNSNQWPLEFLAILMSSKNQLMNWLQTDQNMREQAQKILMNKGFIPTKAYLTGYVQYINFPLIEWFFDELDLSVQKYSNMKLVELITVLSLEEFLQRNNLIDFKFTLSLPGPSSLPMTRK